MHKDDYIYLDRRFRDLTKKELETPESLASLNDRDFLPADGWPEILRHPRVVLLAEAGSGKSEEMRQQMMRLRGEGRPAFYLDLVSLDDDAPTNLMDPEEEASFLAWKVDKTSTAWFFLDAVDELKLTQGKLERALNRLLREASGLLHRIHVVMSSRPSDWRPRDMATFKAKLPIVAFETSMAPAPDEVFLAAIRDEDVRRDPDPMPTVGVDGPRTVILLPLSERQIETFARRRGIADAAAFLAEIRRQDAWAFARRPLDLSELAQTWTTLGTLGKRVEQHEANIKAKLRDDGERPDQDVLSDTRAREGAERLAFAMALTRARTIHSPEQRFDVERTEGALDAAVILPDWNEVERQTLLRRALFDPATYGRVRFHHRSVQEYLAACHLRRLREKGMPVHGLRRLLLAELYGEHLVKPSVRPIAAWMALWDQDVRRELAEREPETLLTHGDPGSLPLDVRRTLLRAFVEMYGDGRPRGLDTPLAEVRRLAHPELATVIGELWAGGWSNPEVHDLLLEMMWQGAIEGCADIAEAAARDIELSWYQRVAATRALLACNLTQAVRGIADSAIGEPTMWPDRFVQVIAVDLFPNVLTVGELITLVERTRETKEVIGGFAWAMRQIVERLDLWSEASSRLRDALADLIWRGRNPTQHWHNVKGRFDHMAPALALLCDRQLSAFPEKCDAAMSRACAIASRFGHDEVGVRELVRDLRKRFEADPALREVAFWSEVALLDELAPATDGFERYFRAQPGGLTGDLNEIDRPWLEKALREHADPRRRVVALHALIVLWFSRGLVESELNALRAATSDDTGLSETLRERTSPPAPNPEAERMERNARRRERVHEGRSRQRIEEWTRWRDELKTNPGSAFSPENLLTAAANLYSWLSGAKRGENRLNVWDYEALGQAFGEDVAKRAECAFKEIWRANPPVLWSRRPAEERNTILGIWTYGLCGLAAEAASPGWTSRLTREEARTAAAYATIEINEFPTWLADLAATHSNEVVAVLGDELAGELAAGAEHPFLSTLQRLSRADHHVKRPFVSQILAEVCGRSWTAPRRPGSSHWVQHLTAALQILNDAGDTGQKAILAAECERFYLIDPSAIASPVWLRQLFRLDPSRAASALESGLGSLPECCRTASAISLFASLFGGRESLLLEFDDDAVRAAVLERLVRCAYEYVHPRDDRQHEGSYTPGTRDNAETGRGFLLSALLDTSGPEAHRAILALADDPLFAHFPDRLRLLARHQAASDADTQRLEVAAVVALNMRYELPPNDRNSLFEVMVDRLDDLQQEVAHDDFTIRRTLRSITDEIEMQRYLARRLRDMAKGAYIVTREEEVADRKEPDIRLITNGGSHKAAIEVKVASSWSLAELERALRDQLVAQYLRDEGCRAGCLLLTYEGKKKSWNNKDLGINLDFDDLIKHLAAMGYKLEREQAYAFRLAVYGLDLQDPPLLAAHHLSEIRVKKQRGKK